MFSMIGIKPNTEPHDESWTEFGEAALDGRPLFAVLQKRSNPFLVTTDPKSKILRNRNLFEIIKTGTTMTTPVSAYWAQECRWDLVSYAYANLVSFSQINNNQHKSQNQIWLEVVSCPILYARQ